MPFVVIQFIYKAFIKPNIAFVQSEQFCSIIHVKHITNISVDVDYISHSMPLHGRSLHGMQIAKALVRILQLEPWAAGANIWPTRALVVQSISLTKFSVKNSLITMYVNNICRK